MILYESKTFNSQIQSSFPPALPIDVFLRAVSSTHPPGLITQRSNRSTEKARDLEILIATVLQQHHQLLQRPWPVMVRLAQRWVSGLFLWCLNGKIWEKWWESTGLGRVVPYCAHILGLQGTGLAQRFNVTTLNGAPSNGSWSESIWTWPEIICANIILLVLVILPYPHKY